MDQQAAEKDHNQAYHVRIGLGYLKRWKAEGRTAISDCIVDCSLHQRRVTSTMFSARFQCNPPMTVSSRFSFFFFLLAKIRCAPKTPELV